MQSTKSVQELMVLNTQIPLLTLQLQLWIRKNLELLSEEKGGSNLQKKDLDTWT